MANGDFLFFGKSSVFARAPPLAIRIIAPFSLSICSCQRSALCAIVLLCLLQVSCDAVRMSNVVRRSPETAKLFSQQRMRMSAMACKWIIVSATSPFFLFFIPCARRSLLHSQIGSGVCGVNDGVHLPLNIASDSVCHCTLLAARCSFPVQSFHLLSDYQNDRRQNWQIRDTVEAAGRARSKWRTENHTTAPALPYCRTAALKDKQQNHRETTTTTKNQRTNSQKYIFLMFYRLCGHYTKLLSLGTVFVGCWILDDIVKAHRRCRCFAWHCCARNSTAISLGNVFAAPQYMRYVSWWIMAYAPHTMPPP